MVHSHDPKKKRKHNNIIAQNILNELDKHIGFLGRSSVEMA